LANQDFYPLKSRFLCTAAIFLLFIASIASLRAASEDEPFETYIRQAADLEHKGSKDKALQVIKEALKKYSALPPYSDQGSQIRVRLAELQLLNNQQDEAISSTKNILENSQRIRANVTGNGDFWLELGYLKDLLAKYGEEKDSPQALECANEICLRFKELRCKPRNTLELLCKSYIHHKQWSGLETSSQKLLALSDNPLTRISSLAMLELAYEKQGKKKEAHQLSQEINTISPKTPENERVWHRDMALVQSSVLNLEKAMTEIEAAIALDNGLKGSLRTTQLATDLGKKAEIERLLGKLPEAIKDARAANQMWTESSPELWRGSSAALFSNCQGETLLTLEEALRAAHKNAEADSIRSHRRQIQYTP